MKIEKDIFNGKISAELRGLVKLTLIFASLIFFLCGMLFLLIAIFYNNVEQSARTFLFCISPICFALSVFFPLITLKLIKIYPKHRKITRHFIKEYVFREYDHSAEKSIYND